jgi:hypothetical protein
MGVGAMLLKPTPHNGKGGEETMRSLRRWPVTACAAALLVFVTARAFMERELPVQGTLAFVIQLLAVLMIGVAASIDVGLRIEKRINEQSDTQARGL